MVSKSYDALADRFHPCSIVQDGGKNADAVLPIVHVLFSNVKTWLNGTFHGVSAKHLPRYAREWNYRFNRRRRIADPTDFLLRRAATRSTITYRQLVDGVQLSAAKGAATDMVDLTHRATSRPNPTLLSPAFRRGGRPHSADSGRSRDCDRTARFDP